MADEATRRLQEELIERVDDLKEDALTPEQAKELAEKRTKYEAAVTKYKQSDPEAQYQLRVEEILTADDRTNEVFLAYFREVDIPTHKELARKQASGTQHLDIAEWLIGKLWVVGDIDYKLRPKVLQHGYLVLLKGLNDGLHSSVKKT